VSGPRAAGSGREAILACTKRRPRRPRAARLLAPLIGLVAALALPASAAAIDEFPLPTPGSCPGGMTAGPDGALWFSEEGTSRIGRMTATGAFAGEVTIPNSANPTPCSDPSFVPPLDQIAVGSDNRLYFTEPRDDQIGSIDPFNPSTSLVEYGTGDGMTPGARPEGITQGPDGLIWFTEAGLGKIGRLNPAGTPKITEYPNVALGGGPSDITTGPDGALWFTEAVAGSVRQITTSGFISNPFPATAGSGPSGITNGPGGLWFTESNTNAIGRITTGGVVSEFPGTGAGPSAIAVGRDGALWFTESEAHSIGRITSGGAITNHFPTPTAGSEPSDVTGGPDGALWFTERAADKIGRIETALPAPPPPPPPPVAIAPPVTKKKKRACKVPKVKGLSVRKAKKKLKKAKCKFKVRGRGYVVSTKPKAGKRTTKRVLVKAKPRKPRRRTR
jgi:virginiamycin B lyase